MIGFSKILTGKATVAATLHGQQSGCLPPHLLQFSSASRPVVVWNMTKRCNLRCCHCYIEAGAVEQDRVLSTDEGLSLIHELAELKIPVLLFSGGEPLMRSDLWDLASEAARCGIRIALSTNGTLIDQEAAGRLKDCGFSYVGVSIDGTPGNHDRFRGVSGAFDGALRGLRTARDAGLTVGVRFTVNRDNYSDLSYLFKMIRDEEIRRFCIYHLVYAGRGKEMAALDLSAKQKREMVDMIIEQALALDRDGVEAEILTTDHHADGIYLYHWVQEHQPERAAEVKQLLSMHGGCSAGVKMANIDPAGYVYPCQFWRSETLGKFPEKSFQEIWFNKHNELLKALRDKPAHLKDRCGLCRAKELCGGCRIRAEAATGDRWQSDPICYLTDAEIQAEV